MTGYFSIGEVSSLLGLTTQTLRYYSKRGILPPAWINPATGYRYYTYDQLQVINRIRYLEGLGLCLSDIEKVLKENDIEFLISQLKAQLQQSKQQLENLQQKCQDTEWYINYFSTAQKKEPLHIPYLQVYNARYFLVSRVVDGNEANSFNELNLLKNSDPYKNLRFYLWYVYIMDYDPFAKGPPVSPNTSGSCSRKIPGLSPPIS